MLNVNYTYAYLARIKTQRQETLNLAYLKTLHRNHMLNIPFENLDISMKNQVRLDVDSLFRKIVLRKRGGFCYELNGLFHQLLIALGYEARLIAARVYNDNELGPEFDHMVILVRLDSRDILVDVGFGDSFLNPKMIQPGLIQMDYNQYYKVEKTVDRDYILSRSDDSLTYKKMYLFNKEEKKIIQFVDMCNYHQTNPKSKFTKCRVITQPKLDGRITLTNQKISIAKLGLTDVQEIINHDDFCVKLYQHFKILFRVNR